MADSRLCVGFSSACKQAREGGGLPGYEGRVSRGRALRPFLPPDLVRLIDALVRRLEHEDTLLRINGGVLGRTLCEAAGAGGLLDLEARTTHTTRNGNVAHWTALLWAAHRGHLAVCSILLDEGAQKRNGALLNASLKGHTPVVALMLDRGAVIEYKDGKSLRAAAQEGHLATVVLLLERGADIHAQEDIPLCLASMRGQLATITLLLDRGANIHARNDYALRAAWENGHTAVVALLLERGALDTDH